MSPRDETAVEAAEGVEDNGKGVWRELGDLPEGAIVNEEALAHIFGRCQTSIKRAVERGELPPPTRLLGKPVWTAGVLLRHIEGRLKAERKEKKREKKRLDKFSP